MKSLSTGELAAIVGGRLRLGSMPPLGGDLEPVGRLAIDSRAVQPGEVFWGLSPQVGAANLAEEAFARGASGVVVSSRRVEPWAGKFSIEVDDARWALWQLGRTMRSRFDGRVIAVAGGPGKTIARAMIDHVLDGQFAGTAPDDTERHADYLHVGLPLALSDLDEEHDCAVIELHGCRAGELEAQTKLCRPDVAVVTPLCGSGAGQEDALSGYLELLESLPEDSLAVLCGDDPRHERLAAAAAKKNMMRVGRGADCDLVAEEVHFDGGELSLVLDGQPVRVPVWGRHHLPSVLAAFAVGRLMGLAADRIAAALARFAPPEGRCSVVKRDGVTVVDDTSCTSLTSARAALVALRDAARNGRRLLVLGEIPAAAATVQQSSRLLGAAAVAQCGAELLIACGEGSEHVVSAAREAGMPREAALACDADSAAQAIAGLVQPGDTVLVLGGPAGRLNRLACSITRHIPHDDNTLPRTEPAPRLADIIKVPPLAPALREAGAALPPGLEH